MYFNFNKNSCILLKISIFLLFPLLTFGETYYEVRSSTGETSLQPASAVGNLEQQTQLQQQQLSSSSSSPQPNAAAGASSNSGFKPFGSLSLPESYSLFSLGNYFSTLPFVGGVVLGAALVYICKYFFSGGGKLLVSKFYNHDEEVIDEKEAADLKKDAETSNKKEEVKSEEGKSRRKRRAYRVARAAGRIQAGIDDFENRYSY